MCSVRTSRSELRTTKSISLWARNRLTSLATLGGSTRSADLFNRMGIHAWTPGSSEIDSMSSTSSSSDGNTRISWYFLYDTRLVVVCSLVFEPPAPIHYYTIQRNNVKMRKQIIYIYIYERRTFNNNLIKYTRVLNVI